MADSRSRSTASSASSHPASMSSDWYSRRDCARPCSASQPSMSLPWPILACSAASACSRAVRSPSVRLAWSHASAVWRWRPCSVSTVAASVASASCLPARSPFSAASCSSTSRMNSVDGAVIAASSLSRRPCRSFSAVSDDVALSRRVSATRSDCSACAMACCCELSVASACAHGGGERRQRILGFGFGVGRRLAQATRLHERILGLRALAFERLRHAGDAGQRLLELGHLGLDAIVRVAREGELLLEARHLGIDRIERALLRVQVVAGGVVARCASASSFASSARMSAWIASSALVSVTISAVNFSRERTASCCLANQSMCCDCVSRAVSSRILRRHFRLLREALELPAELVADVLHARQVLAGIGKPPFGLLAPLLVLRHARGFLEEDAQLLGLGLDHARDHALLDDRVGARAEAGAEEEVVDVAAADRDVVDVVGRVAVAREHALDRDLGVLPPLAADAPEAVVEMKLHRRASHGLAIAGAVEDHVLHRLAAQRGGLGLAEHPAHGIDHVRLAAAVGADDADELARACRWWWDRRTT